MSIFDSRDKPAYTNFHTEPEYAKNKYILDWWSPLHDELLVKQINEDQWIWYWQITDSIVANTEKSTLEKWQKEDPLCSKYAWYNILMYFSVARANILGLTKGIRKPNWKKCPLCNHGFIESSLPVPLVKRLGINRLDYCAPCLSDTIFQNSGNSKLSKEEVIIYLLDLASVLGKVPTQSFGEGITDLYDMDDETRLSVLKVLKSKPTTIRVKELFGSWLNALIKAGILEDGTRKTSRGIQTLAQDGHVCFSLGEKTIDDYLFKREIPHKREPRYPEGNYRGDFLVDGVFIEYFGLKGNPDYDAKTKLKQKICKKHNIRLISIYPADLVSKAKMESKLAPILSKHASNNF